MAHEEECNYNLLAIASKQDESWTIIPINVKVGAQDYIHHALGHMRKMSRMRRLSWMVETRGWSPKPQLCALICTDDRSLL